MIDFLQVRPLTPFSGCLKSALFNMFFKTQPHPPMHFSMMVPNVLGSVLLFASNHRYGLQIQTNWTVHRMLVVLSGSCVFQYCGVPDQLLKPYRRDDRYAVDLFLIFRINTVKLNHDLLNLRLLSLPCCRNTADVSCFRFVGVHKENLIPSYRKHKT